MKSNFWAILVYSSLKESIGSGMADGWAKADILKQRPEPSAGSGPALSIADASDPSLDDARFGQGKIPISIASLRAATVAADAIVLSIIAVVCIHFSGQTLLGAAVGFALPFVLIPVLVVWGLTNASVYQIGFRRSIVDHVIMVGNVSGFVLACLGLITYVLVGKSEASWALIAMMSAWVSLIALHAHYVSGIKSLIRRGRLSENVVIVGATPNAQRLIERNAQLREVNIVGVFDDRLSRAPRNLSGAPLLGHLNDLFTWQRLPEVDKIIVTITPDAKHRVRELVDRLRILPQRIVLLLDFDGFNPETESLAEIAHSPAAYVSGQPKDARRAIVKRAADIFFASAMLVAFSPVLLATAIAVKASSPGPVIFRQRRHGFNNQIIRVWKFRSMKDDKAAAEKMSAQTQQNDPRVTRIGRFIRRTSIDELPQLINVLRGEMSIVGPRPHAVGMTTEETEVHTIIGDYAHRHRVKPGITGWAQINGSRGPLHTKDGVRTRVELDMEYVNRSSFWFDLYIMIMTAPCLLGDRQRDR